MTVGAAEAATAGKEGGVATRARGEAQRRAADCGVARVAAAGTAAAWAATGVWAGAERAKA